MNQHRIRIEYAVDQPHVRGSMPVQIECAGSGDLTHWLNTLRAALVAAGYSLETAMNLNFSRPEEIGVTVNLSAKNPNEIIEELRRGLRS